MELFYCEQCEKRIATAEVEQAKAQAPALGGKMYCAACRPQLQPAPPQTRPPTAEMRMQPRSTARMPRKTPATEAGSRRVPMFGGAPPAGQEMPESPVVPSLSAGAPPPPLPPLPPRHFSPPRGNDAPSGRSATGSGARPATAIRPFKASISNRGAPAVRQPEPASAPAGTQTRRNFPVLIGIYVAGVCLLGGAVALLWPGKREAPNPVVADNDNSRTTENRAPVPAPPTPAQPERTPVANATPETKPDKPPPNYTMKTPPAPPAPPAPPTTPKVKPAPPSPPPPPPPPATVTRPAPRMELPELHVAALQGSPPKIDGLLDDMAWREAVSIDLNRLTDGKPSKGKARAAVLFDDKNLYISVQCFEDAKTLAALKADATPEHPDNAWADDSVEIFIDPANTRQSYYQIAVNSKGVHWEAYLPKISKPDTSWKPKLSVAANVGKVSWTIEVAVPLAAFDQTPVGPEWAFNLVHTRTADDELLLWSPLYDPSNHVPARFGKLLGMPTK